jgi:rfaE bifunctional protein kinase chain/domain
MTDKIDIGRLLNAVEKFRQARILVLGDIMLDRFIWGKVGRISPEAPVPVVEVDTETSMLGGAANVLHNLVALGGSAVMCGMIGQDEAGDKVVELLDDLESFTHGVMRCPDRPTTVKTRIVAQGQQVVRVDWELKRPPGDEELEMLGTFLLEEIRRCDAVIISDYAKGVVTGQLLEPLLNMARQGKLIVNVDPKVDNMPLYKGATLVTPNHHEACAAAKVSLDDPDHTATAGRRLLRELEAGSILVTQGEKGMTLFAPDGETHIPTAAKRVFDVTGAGDTVISTLTMGMVSGLALNEAAILANLAAGIVVGEVGTSAVTGGRLSQALQDAGFDYRKVSVH